MNNQEYVCYINWCPILAILKFYIPSSNFFVYKRFCINSNYFYGVLIVVDLFKTCFMSYEEIWIRLCSNVFIRIDECWIQNLEINETIKFCLVNIISYLYLAYWVKHYITGHNKSRFQIQMNKYRFKRKEKTYFNFNE